MYRSVSENTPSCSDHVSHRTSRISRRAFVLGSSAVVGAGHALFNTVMSMAQSEEGGAIVVSLIQEPGQLNEFFNAQSGSFISVLAVEPLFTFDANGEPVPILASEVPSLENGGISEDSLTITYRIRQGITWSDGEPFTAEDLAFTFDVYRDPESTTLAGGAYDAIESVNVVDELTAEVKMSVINPGYLDLWDTVLPKHKFDSTAVTQDHEQARIPLGTGPFVIAAWNNGDEIVFERNENYREPGQPILDRVTVKITPERETAVSGFLNGEFDYVYFLTTADLPRLSDAIDDGVPIEIEILDGGGSVEFMFLNQTMNGDPSVPHPVLGDPAVREAMDHGIDRQIIIDEILGGYGSLSGAIIFAGWAGEHIDTAPFDPDRANAILDDAGWVQGSDGVREKDGVRASLRFQTVTNDLTRELYQQVIQQNMKDIGIEIQIQNVPSTTLLASWSEGGVVARGDWDIFMVRDGNDIDPLDWAGIFKTDAIPGEDNPSGQSRTFYSNPELDAILDQAASTLDQESRRELYSQANEIFARDRPALPLYRQTSAVTYASALKGFNLDIYSYTYVLYSANQWYVED